MALLRSRGSRHKRIVPLGLLVTTVRLTHGVYSSCICTRMPEPVLGFVRRNTHSNIDSNPQTNINPGLVMTATISYIRGTSETITRILQPYSIRVAHKPITTLRRLLTNVKDKDKPEDRQGAVYMIKCCDCQASYIGETGRNVSRRLTEHKQATRNGDINNHIAEHHLQTKHQIDWDSATCITYSTDYYQRVTLESWFTKLEQMPLNRSQQ